MKCPNCHKEVPDSAKVCGYCGTRLTKPAEELKAAKKKETKPKAAQKQTVSEKKPEAIEKSKKKIAAAEAPLQKFQAKRTPLPARALPITIALIVLLAIAAYFLFYSPFGQGEAIAVAGRWIGEIHSTEGESFSATLELEIDKHCSIGDICGSYRIIDGQFHGDLELVSIEGSRYKFKEHEKGAGSSEGIGYETLNLTGEALYYRYEQTQSSGEIIRSAGKLYHK